MRSRSETRCLSSRSISLSMLLTSWLSLKLGYAILPMMTRSLEPCRFLATRLYMWREDIIRMYIQGRRGCPPLQIKYEIGIEVVVESKIIREYWSHTHCFIHCETGCGLLSAAIENKQVHGWPVHYRISGLPWAPYSKIAEHSNCRWF